MANRPKSSGNSRKHYTLDKFGVSSQLELVTRKECYDIAMIDAHDMATNKDTYCGANWRTYYCICNLYLLQAREISVEAEMELGTALRTKGLVCVIKDFDDAANTLVRTGTTSGIEPYISSIIDSVYASGDPTDLRRVLQFLRFAKRFSPVESDRVRERTMTTFVDINKSRNYYVYDGKRSKDCVRFPSWLVNRVRSVISNILDGYTPSVLGTISTGVCKDASRLLVDKLSAISRYLPSWCDVTYPVSPMCDIELDENRTITMIAVPKSYKAHRLIAPEYAYHQYVMQRIRIGINDSICRNGYSEYILIDDQDVQRNRALQSSIDGRFATVDLTAASDSISSVLASEILPISLWNDVMAVRAYYIECNAQRFRLDTFLTSGSACTFPIETIVFWAIAYVATELYCIFTNEPFDESKYPTAFGDDTVVYSAAVDTYYDLLELLNFTVNHNKSFAGSIPYRESCGSEFYDGVDIASTYWPRTTFEWSTDGHVAVNLASLCQLQHNLYSRSTLSRYFLAEIVRSIEPRMTSHVPGIACADLWEKVPKFTKSEAPRKRWNLQETRDGRTGKVVKVRVELPDTAPQHALVRERHLTLSSTWASADHDPISVRMIEMWRYVNFLHHGPQYVDAFARLVGVTSPLPSIDTGLVLPDVKWTMITE